MKAGLRVLLLLPVLAIIASCHTINTVPSTVVKEFAGSAKEVSDLPYKIVYSCHTVRKYNDPAAG